MRGARRRAGGATGRRRAGRRRGPAVGAVGLQSAAAGNGQRPARTAGSSRLMPATASRLAVTRGFGQRAAARRRRRRRPPARGWRVPAGSRARRGRRPPPPSAPAARRRVGRSPCRAWRYTSTTTGAYASRHKRQLRCEGGTDWMGYQAGGARGAEGLGGGDGPGAVAGSARRIPADATARPRQAAAAPPAGRVHAVAGPQPSHGPA